MFTLELRYLVGCDHTSPSFLLTLKVGKDGETEQPVTKDFAEELVQVWSDIVQNTRKSRPNVLTRHDKQGPKSK